MRQHRRSMLGYGLSSVAGLAMPLKPVFAQQVDLTVTHYGVGMYGLPFAVARDKGWFRELAGLDVRGFFGSGRGGTALRNAMASEIPYGEVSLAAAIQAIQQGADFAIVHGGVHSMADQVWVTRPNETGITRFADLAGRRIAFSNPRSVTDIITSILLERHGLVGRVERKAIGGMDAGLSALREGGVDLAYLTEPAYSREKSNYRRVWSSADIVPRMVQTVGVVKRDFMAKNPRVVRGIIEARRRGVEFIRAQPTGAALIMAREYTLDAGHARQAIDNVLTAPGNYWSLGALDEEGMTAMFKGLVLVRAIAPDAMDWGKVVDDHFLQPPLRGLR